MKKLILILIIALFAFGCEQPTDAIVDEVIEDPIIEDPIPEPEPEPEPEMVQLFYDTVEFGIKDWVAESPWYIVTGYSYSLIRSWSERSGNYLADADYSLISKSFDFTGYENIELVFWQAYWFEEDYDFGYIEYSIDDGATWLTADNVTGEKYYWSKGTVGLPVAGEATVKVRFRVVSDSTIQYPGWFIDEIIIQGSIISFD